MPKLLANPLHAIFLVMSLAGFAQNSKPLPRLGKNSIKEVVSALTLEEKAKLAVGNGFRMPGPPPSAPRRDSAGNIIQGGTGASGSPAAPAGGPVIGITEDKVPGAAGTSFALARLGIPSMVVADGPAGLRISPVRKSDSTRKYYATAFPVSTLLASTWDTELVKNVGIAFGNEVHEYGVDVLLAPALNIHRNPLGGRNFEYYSEDPLVAGEITAAIVSGIQSNGVGTSIKHFALNNQETNRNTVDVVVSERAMREIYLKGFQIAVKKSNPWTVMSSYNLLNGTYTSQNYDLITTILRKEWGFKGFVMTDWFGGKDPVEQMKAGNDLIMPGTPQQAQRIIDAVNHDSLDVKILDENVSRILTVMLQSPAFKGYKYSDMPDLKGHAAIARKAATEGMILLRNNSSTLPLKSVSKIAAYGNTSYDIISGGTGSGDVNEAYTISLADGLKNAGFVVEESLQKIYIDYIATEKTKRPKPRGFFDAPKPIQEMAIDDASLLSQSASNDIAIITIGRNAGEGADRKIENDFYLTEAEKKLIKDVSSSFHSKGKKVVLVLNVGGVVETASWRDDVDAILLSWQPGMEAGNAIADILSGKVDPSGKLTTTFPLKYEDEPSAKDFPGKEFPEKATTGMFGRKQIPAEVVYEEGIYVGYRYYNTFRVKPAYEFGYGLSYSSFSYGDLKTNSPDFNNKINATITITNTGKTAGKEVVQLYLSAPSKTMDKPALELKAFAKTKLLATGESQTLTFTLNAQDLASFSSAKGGWVAEAGDYTIRIGASSADIKQTKSFKLRKEIITEKVHHVILPQKEIQELKPGQANSTGFIYDLNAFYTLGK